LGGRRRRISEFEASLVYKVSSRTAPGLYRETLSRTAAPPPQKKRKRKRKIRINLSMREGEEKGEERRGVEGKGGGGQEGKGGETLLKSSSGVHPFLLLCLY
jgi:hypothetical protein